MPSAIIVRGEPVSCDAPVKLWRETGLTFRARGKRSETRLIGVHWTGGERGGEGIHETLSTRRNKRGLLMRLSVQFAIDHHGVIWQYTDADDYCQHIGVANGYSVGIEIANRAKPPAEHERWPREVYTEHVHGRPFECTRFYPQQVESCRKLVDALSRAYGLPIEVPRGADGKLVTTVLPLNELRSFRGVVGHYHVTSKKDDPGTEILETLTRR